MEQERINEEKRQREIEIERQAAENRMKARLREMEEKREKEGREKERKIKLAALSSKIISRRVAWAATTIQRAWRHNQRVRAFRRHHAAKIIQRALRKQQCRCREIAAEVLQRSFRQFMARKKRQKLMAVRTIEGTGWARVPFLTE